MDGNKNFTMWKNVTITQIHTKKHPHIDKILGGGPYIERQNDKILISNQYGILNNPITSRELKFLSNMEWANIIMFKLDNIKSKF